MRSHGGHFSLTPGPLTLPLTWPAWHFNPRPTARMAAALPTTAYITLSSHVLRSVLMAGLHGASCFCLIAYARVPSSSRDGLSFPCRRVASTLALMRHSPYAWLACPPSQDAAWSFYLYAYPSSVFTWRVSGEDVHVLPCPLLSYAGFVCPAGLRGLWKVINNVYIITCTRNIFASFLRCSFDLWVGRATCSSFYTAVWSVYFFFPLLTWLFPSLCVYDLRCSCFSLRAVNAGQPRARDGESEFCPTLRFACSVYLQFSPSAFKVLYILSKYRKWNYGGSKFICSLCIEISAAAIFSRLSD